MNKNYFEKIINYLISYDFRDIKLIYIEKEKYINTITNDKSKNNNINEKGFSISFSYNNQPFFIALNNLEKFSIIKKRINEIIKYKKRVIINHKLSIKEDYFNIKETNFEYFDVVKYNDDLKKFINENNLEMSIRIPLLSERKRTFIISLDRVTYKEEYNYKIDIIMNAIINGINRFNYFSLASSSNLGDIKKLSVYDELNKLYHVIKKMQSIEAKDIKTDIVLSNGIGGIIVHESCGHALESREINKKSSVFNNVNSVDNKIINIIDNPTINGVFGSFNIDDEGNKSRNNILIENGKIKRYLTDERSLFSNSSSGRRESYYYMPSSRMSNTYIDNGKDDFESIISSVKNGYYIKNILGGVVDTISGNFSFNCLESYKIKNGKIDYSVCYDNLTIIGNTINILKNINMIGNDLKLSPGICGSESGFVYTTVGQPTIRIKDLLVVMRK